MKTLYDAWEPRQHPQDHPDSPGRDKVQDRERIESLYLTRQCTKEEFYAWLEQGGHINTSVRRRKL